MISSLHIQTETKEGRTLLKQVFFTPPFKVADITEDRKSEMLRLMLMSSSPGILDGDAYDLKIDIAAGSSLDLRTQSFQRIFMMKKSASQNLEVNMNKNSSFCFLPHPAVPHVKSDFTAHNKINLSDQCSLIWGEVLTCGRKLNGEVFQFSKYHNLTEIFLNGRLILKENLLMRPASHALHAMGYLEGFTHQASFIYLNETAPMNEFNELITTQLSDEKEIAFGVTLAPVSGLIVRILGHRAEQLHECLKKIAQGLHTHTSKKEQVYAK